MDYKKELDRIFKSHIQENECESCSKLAFLGNVIFDFTTYDGEMDELFAEKMIEVIDSILNGKTFDYIKDRSNYINYLTMVNMPFLKEKIDWGTSVRGAWFDEYGYPSGQNAAVYEIGCEGDLVVPKIKVKEFMKELIVWSRSNIDAD